MEHGKDKITKFNMAGIIAVAGQKLDYGMTWHDSLTQIGINYTAVEKSVCECAMAGCDSIWIVCRSCEAPLVKYRAGEWVDDPVHLDQAISKRTSKLIKRIPIYYVPIHPIDIGRRDSLGWSALYGCLAAWKTTKTISKWTVPDKYFISFPYGLYDLNELRLYRREIKDREKKFFVKYDGKGIKDGLFLPFSCFAKDIILSRREFKFQATSFHQKNSTAPLPIEERYNGRFFTLDKAFSGLILGPDDLSLDLARYEQIDSWEGYKKYCSSDLDLTRPEYLKKHNYNPIGLDYEYIEKPKKERTTLPTFIKRQVQKDHNAGMQMQELIDKYELSGLQIINIIEGRSYVLYDEDSEIRKSEEREKKRQEKEEKKKPKKRPKRKPKKKK